jgi:hypothetical protein
MRSPRRTLPPPKRTQDARRDERSLRRCIIVSAPQRRGTDSASWMAYSLLSVAVAACVPASPRTLAAGGQQRVVFSRRGSARPDGRSLAGRCELKTQSRDSGQASASSPQTKGPTGYHIDGEAMSPQGRVWRQPTATGELHTEAAQSTEIQVAARGSNPMRRLTGIR